MSYTRSRWILRRRPRQTECIGPVPLGGWRRALTPALFAGFGAIVLILMAALAVGLMNLRQVQETSGAVAHTYSVKLALQQLLTRLVDAETGERGYIITNEAGYLEPYNGARQNALSDLARIRTLTSDVHDHSADLERLSRVVERKLGGAGPDDTNTP